MRIYIESTLPSYLVARPARDLLQAARQQITRDWWDFKRQKHELFTSQIVLEEIRKGELAMAQQRKAVLAGISLLAVTAESESLTQRILSSGALPPHAYDDAGHVALATIYGIEVLLSWNLRHIANVAIHSKLRQVVESEGWVLPALCTPEELTEKLYEEPGPDD